jgi:hypothetical protein
MIFGARYIELASQGKIAHILWICHTSSLVIALGFFICQIELIRVSVLWLIIGAPLWPIEIIRTGIMELTSIGTHYVALLVGLLVIRRQGMGKYSWVYALMWFLFLQHLTRLYTPSELNINLSSAAYPGWERFFPSYWQYWLFITGLSVISLWMISKLLSWLSNFKKS